MNIFCVCKKYRYTTMKCWIAALCFLGAISRISGTNDTEYLFVNVKKKEMEWRRSFGAVEEILNITIDEVKIFSNETSLRIYGHDIEPKVNSCIIVTLPGSNCVIQDVTNSCIVIKYAEGVSAVHFISKEPGELLHLKYTKEDCDTDTGNVSTKAVSMAFEFNSTLMYQGTSREVTATVISSTERMTDTSTMITSHGLWSVFGTDVPLYTPENTETTAEDQITSEEVGINMTTIVTSLIVCGSVLLILMIAVNLLIRRRRVQQSTKISVAPENNHNTSQYENQGFHRADSTTPNCTTIPPSFSPITPRSQPIVNVVPTNANVNPLVPNFKGSTFDQKIQSTSTDTDKHYVIMKPGTSNSLGTPKRNHRPSTGDIPFLATTNCEVASHNISRYILPHNPGFRRWHSDDYLDKFDGSDSEDMYVDMEVKNFQLTCPNDSKRNSDSSYVNVVPTDKLNPGEAEETYVDMRSVSPSCLNPESSTPNLRCKKSYLEFWQPIGLTGKKCCQMEKYQSNR